MFEPDGQPRPGYRLLAERMAGFTQGDLQRRQRSAEVALLNMGITFNSYGDPDGVERIFPFDIIPRIIAAADWKVIQAGLEQRMQVLNLFLDDIYHEQKIVSDGVVDEYVIRSARTFLPECIGLDPPKGIWCHIAGSDLVRDSDGTFYVLEDNVRCPSGVSYVLENRSVMKRALPHMFEASRPRPVDDYPGRLLETLQNIGPAGVESPRVALLTPGTYNSAYFEHAYLAMQMGIELVEGRDLVEQGGAVYVRTTKGLQRVDILYRRVDDTFLDPEVFDPGSMLGVPGLMNAYRSGKLGLANAPGTGVADDKVVYAYTPRMIRYYLDQDAILPNVPTYMCWEDEARQYVLDHIGKLVVKAANESGGYGMLIGPQASAEQLEEFAGRIEQNPRNYIAQPTLSLSRVPVIVDDHLEGRHVDLRPFVLYGESIYVLPGGLTRAALKKGSLVVNSSQGGGSKDTWVLSDPEDRC